MTTSLDEKSAHHPLDIYGDSKRITQIFRWFIVTTLLCSIAGIIISISTNRILAAILIAACILPILAAFFLVRYKKFEWASIFLAVILISLLTILATIGLGIHQISNLGFPAILIIASMVTRKRTMVFLTLYAIGCVAWLVFGELSGAYTPTVLIKSVPGDFFSASLAILATAFMARLLTETLFQGSLQLKKELRERKLAEEKYRNIFENAIDGIFQSTPDGHFVNVNPAMARMYGYDSPQEMVQKVTNIASQIYVDPELRNDVRRRLAEGEKITGFESQEYRKDGSRLWSSMNAQAIHAVDGNILYYEGTVEDITLRKEMEIKQKEAETLYRTLVEQTSIVAYRDAPDELGSALYVSPQIETLLGYTANEWLSDPTFWKTRVHPEDLLRVLADVEHYVTKNDESSIEYRMQTKTGDWRWVRDETVIVKDEAGNAQFIHGVFLDITERKQAENALRESQARLDAFFNQSLDGFFFLMFDEPQEWENAVDREKTLHCIFTDQRFTDVNNAMLEQYGLTREKFLSLTSSDIFAHDPQQGLQLRRQLFDKGHLHTETHERREDGTPAWFEGDYVCLYDEQKRITGFFGIQRDITERKRADQALRESEQQLMNSQIIAGLGSYSLDISTGIWKSSDVLDKIFGIDNTYERSIEGWAALIHPDDRQSMIDYFTKDVVGKFVRFDKEYRIVRNNDQTERWVHGMGELEVDAQRRLVRMFGTIQDITEGKRTEAEREGLIKELEIKNAESETLRESFAAIVGTFEFIEIIQHILDQIKRVIPYDSASVWQLEGTVQKSIASRNLPAETPIGEMEIVVNEINSALPILRGEVPYILNHNVQAELLDFKDPPHNIINSWLAIPLKTRGKIIGLIALDGHRNNQFNEHHAQLAVTFANQVAIALENARLFTELQSELSTRENLIKELESKNTELERFTYTVSHDLKSPLVTINGFLGYLKGDAASGNSERVNVDIQRIQDAVDKMHLLLKELLELSRIGRIMNPPETVPFEDIVQNALELVHGRLAAQGVTVQTQPNLPAIHGDRQRLTVVLQNLIDNAAKYMGTQASPHIEIGQHGEDAENGKFIFYVKDNGMGIPPEHHERIFGLFDKLDPKSEGTGVGLALVKRIIEVHGGRIWVESETRKGSTFYFTLPRSN